MNSTFARLLSTVVLPAALLTGAIGCHQESRAKSVASMAEPAPAEPTVTVFYDAPLVPKDRSDLIVYTARIDGESRTKVFVQGAAGEAPRLVYVDAEPGQLIRVSDDGTRGVYRRFVSAGVTEDVAVDFQKSEG